MRKTIEYAISLELQKIRNLRVALNGIEGKLVSLQEERARLEQAIENSKQRIAEIGIRPIADIKAQRTLTPTEEQKIEAYNSRLKVEKTQFIQNSIDEKEEASSPIPSNYEEILNWMQKS